MHRLLMGFTLPAEVSLTAAGSGTGKQPGAGKLKGARGEQTGAVGERAAAGMARRRGEPGENFFDRKGIEAANIALEVVNGMAEETPLEGEGKRCQLSAGERPTGGVGDPEAGKQWRQLCGPDGFFSLSDCSQGGNVLHQAGVEGGGKAGEEVVAEEVAAVVKILVGGILAPGLMASC